VMSLLVKRSGPENTKKKMSHMGAANKKEKVAWVGCHKVKLIFMRWLETSSIK
jgi:hypothetical protein